MVSVVLAFAITAKLVLQQLLWLSRRVTALPQLATTVLSDNVSQPHHSWRLPYYRTMCHSPTTVGDRCIAIAPQLVVATLSNVALQHHHSWWLLHRQTLRCWPVQSTSSWRHSRRPFDVVVRRPLDFRRTLVEHLSDFRQTFVGRLLDVHPMFIVVSSDGSFVSPTFVVVPFDSSFVSSNIRCRSVRWQFRSVRREFHFVQHSLSFHPKVVSFRSMFVPVPSNIRHCPSV